MFQDPNFNPFTANFSQGKVYDARERFWLNFIIVTQVINGVVLFISIV